MQNWKKYPIQKAQLIIADVPYNVGNNFYGSNPMWYNGGDNSNGESKLAGKAAFYSDYNFNLYEYFHFCSQLMKKEPKRGGERGQASQAPCMIVFCSFEQQHDLIKAADKLAAYIKCVEELRSGNKEFSKAEATLKKELAKYFEYEEVKYFFDTFAATFKKTLDELE